MTAEPRQGVRACVFGAFGTIFDFASAAARCTDAPVDEAARLTAL
jgi:2-haloacid dehalogenase